MVGEPTGLLVHWTLDETSGRVAADSSGREHDASLRGSGARWKPGRIGGALSFNGKDGAFAEDPEGGEVLNGLSELTITLWVKSDRTGTNRGLLIATEPDGKDEVLSLRYDAAGWANGNKHKNLIKAGITTTGGVQQLESSPGMQTTGWQFIALRWESGKRLRLFVNGERDEPTFNSRATHGVVTGATLLRLGQGAKDLERSWDGMIDDVRVYGRALGAKELRAQYLESANLLAHWKLDESKGKKAADASGHGHDAVFHRPGPKWTEGRIGGALAFSGADGAYLEDADGADYVNGLRAFTVTLWARSDRKGTNRGLLAAKEPDGRDEVLSLRYDAAGRERNDRYENLIKAAITTTGGVQVLESSPGLQTRAWQFIALTWSSGETLRLYVDGKLDRPTYNSRPTRGLITGATGLRLGQGPKDKDRTWDGLVDDVRIYGRELRAAEIRRLAHPRPGPEPPSGLVSTAVTSRRVDLAWQPSPSASVSSYGVYRDGSRIATTTDTSFEDEGLSPSTRYVYSVTALDASGDESAPSGALAVKTKQSRDETAPTVPEGATAAALGATQALLSWSASVDAGGVDEPTSGLAGYRVYRDGQLRATLGLVTTFADAGLTASRTYLYAVSAFDAAGNESATASLPPLTTPEPGTGQDVVGVAGGRVQTSDGRVSLVVPPGALIGPVPLTLREVGPAPEAIGPVYEIGPSGTVFAAPVRVELSYAALASQGMPFRSLRVAWLDGGKQRLLKDAAIDEERQVVSGATTHLSLFALASTVDLFDYVIASCSGPSPVRGGERRTMPVVDPRFAQPADPKLKRGHVYYVKSADGTGFEEWAADAYYIYELTDTTWARGFRSGDQLACDQSNSCTLAADCDFVCGTTQCARRWRCRDVPPASWASFDDTRDVCAALEPGGGMEWAFTRYYCVNHSDHEPQATCADGVLGAHWLKRRVANQDEFTTHFRIKAAGQQDCSEGCSAIEPPSGGSIEGESSHRVVTTFHESWTAPEGTVFGPVDVDTDGDGATEHLPGVVEIHIADGAGAGEHYWYAHGIGLVAARRGNTGTPDYYGPSDASIPSTPAQMRDCNQTGNPFTADSTQLCAARGAGLGGPEPPDDGDPCPTAAGTYCSLKALSLCVSQNGTTTKDACGTFGCIEEPPGITDHCGDAPVCENGVTTPASSVAKPLPAGLSLRLPFDPATEVVLTQAYGPGTQNTHTNVDGARGPHTQTWPADYYALDLVPLDPSGGSAEGLPIAAAAGGTVRKVGWDPQGYGNFLVVQLNPPHQQYYTLYGHMRDPSLRQEGDTLAVGDRIGVVGQTGSAQGAHLHFAVYFNASAPTVDGHRGAQAVVPEPIDGYACLSGRVGDVLLVGGEGGNVHTQPVTIHQSTTFTAGDLYLIPSASTSLVTTPGVLASPNQSSSELFPVAAIEIDGKDGITLDCNGVWVQSVEGDLTADRSNDRFYGGVGIRVRNSSDVVVRNCNVSGYRYGILVEDSTRVTIEGNRSTHNYRNFTAGFFSDSAAIPSHHFGGGIRVWRGSQIRVLGNQGDNQMSGIELVATNDSEISNNRFNYDQVGLYLARSSGNRVVGNNFDWGIRFETRTWTDGSAQTLLRGGVFDFMDRGLLRVQEDGAVGGLAVKRILRLMDRDTSRPFWDLATMTMDAAGVLIENASHSNEVRGNSLKFGGDGLFIRANQTPCSNGNVVRDNEAAYSPNNGLELSFCDGTFENNLVHSNQHGMWLGAGAHAAVVRGNRFANNLAYAVLGARNGPVTFEGNTVSETPVAIGMRAERWGGSLNLPADASVTRVRDWSVQGNTFDGIRGGAFPWMLLGANDGAVFRLSGVERFDASGNTYGAGSDRCSLPHPSPVPNTPPNLDLNLDCGSPGGVPVAQFVFPTDGASVAGGAHHDFVCHGTDDAALQSVEIVFNDEHHKRCDYAQTAGVTSTDCRFESFYVGADLNGKTVPMDCHATDWTGQTHTHHIGVRVGTADRPPYVQFQTPTDGQKVPPGHNNFTCYASDDKNLDYVEIWFNDEHHHRCNFGPVTAGTCTFSNFYVGTDLLGKTIPMRCDAADLSGNQSHHNIGVVIGSGDAAPPTAQFQSPTGGAQLAGGAHHDFACHGTDDEALQSLEIVFNNEHRKRCDYAQGDLVKSADCRFEDFYVGADLIGKTIPMHCQARDWAGRTWTQYINVGIVASDPQPPYVQFQSPTNGQRVPPGHNSFTCYASDNKNLDYVEIWFNDEHHHRCDFGPVTAGTCTFSDFYVGTDLLGRTIPMRCDAADLSGNRSHHNISVLISN